MFQKNFSRRMFAGLALALGAFGFHASASASELSVSPIRVDITQAQRIVPVSVYNAGDKEVVMETSIRAWRQGESGQWLFSGTEAVHAYPGLIRIQPKSSAVVRVGLVGAFPSSSPQGTYRLFLQELADPRASGSGVRMVLSINLPVFVGGSQTETVFAVPSATILNGGVVNFSYRNPSTANTLSPQSATYSWLDASGKEVAHTQGKIDTYALPGGLGRWNHILPVACQKIARVIIVGDKGVRFDVPVSCAP